MLKLFIPLFIAMAFFFSVCAESSEIQYTVKFEGVGSKEILKKLRSSSHLVSLQKQPPSSQTALLYRAENDVPQLLSVMQYYGYYESEISIRLKRKISQMEVVFHVKTGDRYRFKKFSFSWLDENKEELPSPLLKDSECKLPSLETGSPALAEMVVRMEKWILEKVKNRGFPLATVSHQALAVKSEKTIYIDFYITPGKALKFGRVSIQGLKKTKERYVRKKIAWKNDSLYSLSKIEETQNALLHSGLFNSVSVSHENAPEGETLPIYLTLVERKHRSIGAGINYSSKQGMGGTWEWEHRNIRGMGEKLSIINDINEKKQNAAISFLKPNFLHKKQDLLWSIESEKESTRSYQKRMYNFSVLIKRQVGDKIFLSYGGRIEEQKTTRSDNDGKRTLLGFPLFLSWRNIDNFFYPKRGTIINFSATPFVEAKADLSYLSQKISGAIYSPLDKKEKFVLNTWATFASILGASRIHIPPSHRLYAGSERNLRGYAYQSVSPLDSSKIPLGGLSMMIYGMECNYFIYPSVSLASFYEMGNVYAENRPEFNSKQLKSWGLGIRYHTPVGPLNFDIAFPMDKRENLDQSYQIYISIGPYF